MRAFISAICWLDRAGRPRGRGEEEADISIAWSQFDPIDKLYIKT
jgi:hypothetical protein